MSFGNLILVYLGCLSALWGGWCLLLSARDVRVSGEWTVEVVAGGIVLTALGVPLVLAGVT